MRNAEKWESEVNHLKNETQRLNLALENSEKAREKDAVECDELRQEVETLRREIVDVCQVLKEEQDDKVKLTEEIEKLKKELEIEKSGKSVNKRWAGEWGQEEEIERLKVEIEKLKLNKSDTTTDDAKQYKNELDKLKNQLLSERTDFEQERITWAQEKEKVLRYQRQLQLNYVQMFRRTRTLEAEVESLSMELELENKSKGFRNPKKISVPAIEMGTVVEL